MYESQALGESLFLCLILVYLIGPVKEISHTKSTKRVCLLNKQFDVEFVRPVDG